MASIAQLYPPRMDGNNTIWYRPVKEPGWTSAQWGWTSQIEQADPSYFEPGAPIPNELLKIQRMEMMMDKRRQAMEKLFLEHGESIKDTAAYALEKGRYEGLAAGIVALRKSKLAEEIQRSNERLGI